QSREIIVRPRSYQSFDHSTMLGHLRSRWLFAVKTVQWTLRSPSEPKTSGKRFGCAALRLPENCEVRFRAVTWRELGISAPSGVGAKRRKSASYSKPAQVAFAYSFPFLWQFAAIFCNWYSVLRIPSHSVDLIRAG